MSGFVDGPRSTRAGVLALQGDVVEHARALREAGAQEVREVRRPADLDGLCALVMPGGESTTIGKLMVEYGLDRAIPRHIQGGMSVLGTCAGLILLATEIVGSEQPRLGLVPMVVWRNAYGRHVDSFETTLDVPDISSEPMPAVFIRAPKIESVGDGVDVLARYGGHPVLCRSGRILGATFHPELSDDRRVHRHLLELGAGPRA